MGLVLSNTPQEYQLHPEGQFAAVCVDVIDLGDVKTTWEGKEKIQHKIALVFETSEAMADGRPLTVRRRFTASLNETAALRKFLQSWRGKPFTADELAAFDTDNLVGKPAIVQVYHSVNGDRTYDNIGDAIMRPMAGMAPLRVSGKYVRVQDRPPQGAQQHAAPTQQPLSRPVPTDVASFPVVMPQRTTAPARAAVAASPVAPPHDDNDLPF